MAKRKYYLDLTFDVEQVTKALHYHIDGPKGTPFRTEGPFAGTFYFRPGDELYIRVTATAKKCDEARFSITNFTLASIPTWPAGEIYLSLFDKHCACTDISDWGIPTRGDDDADKKAAIIIEALHPLVIAAPTGQWQMSGYMSTIIETKTLSGDRRQISRLFYFDPESSAGTGGDISDSA